MTWVFPTWWVGMPAVMKALVDRLLAPQWAFRFDEGKALPTGLMAGKSTRYVTTMASPNLWYRLWQAIRSRAAEGVRDLGGAPLPRGLVEESIP